MMVYAKARWLIEATASKCKTRGAGQLRLQQLVRTLDEPKKCKPAKQVKLIRAEALEKVAMHHPGHLLTERESNEANRSHTAIDYHVEKKLAL